ncbi:MAG: hypothetical protein KJP14_10110, partial [Eudoraea sp.]|nr:hypothetical protein [Eudoraea sp.]
MMYILPQPGIRRIALTLLAGIFAISCGSYQQASYYDNDGIYDQGTQRVSVERPVNRPAQRQVQPQKQQEGDGIYGDYFGQKAEQLDEIMENEVFTDVDD